MNNAAPFAPFLSALPRADLQAQKPDFTALPATLQRHICQLAGAQTILKAQTIYGGFSNAACWRMMLDNSRQVFVKGSHPADPSHGAANLRGEVSVCKNNPFIQSHAPALLGMVSEDAGDDNGWWLGVWVDAGQHQRDISANEALLWLEKLSHASISGLPDYRENPYLKGFFDNSRKWRQVSTQPVARQRFEQLFAEGGRWLDKNLAALLQSVEAFSQQELQCGLIHGDLRGDNFLLTTDKTYLIDWANAANGPLVFDGLFLSAALVMRGQLTPQQACDAVADYAHAPLMAASMAGYFADQAGRAPVVAMPRLRLMQTGILVALLEMLAVFRIIDSPPQLAPTLPSDSPTA